MFRFSDSERVYLTEMRAISTDGDGNEVLVGLSLEETAWYMEHSRRFLTSERDRNSENRARYLQLHDKHEIARLGIVGAEHQLRVDHPSRH